MEDFIGGIIRLIFFIIIIRGFFKKSKKAQSNLSPEKLQRKKEKAAAKAEKRRLIQERLEQSLSEAFDDEDQAIAKAFAERKAQRKTELSIYTEKKPVKKIQQRANPQTEKKYQSSYERVKTKRVKKSVETRRKGGLIDKDTLKKDVVRGIIFKEILSEPRSKSPYHLRK